MLPSMNANPTGSQTAPSLMNGLGAAFQLARNLSSIASSGLVPGGLAGAALASLAVGLLQPDQPSAPSEPSTPQPGSTGTPERTA